MPPETERAPQVKWRDLTQMNLMRRIKELLLPVPWLLASWALYAGAWWPLGAGSSFMFFLCALRLNHEAIHSNLGLTRRGDSVVMHVLSMLMLGSNHAEAGCHLRHHRYSMGPDDHEGRCGQMTATQVLLYGPRFPIDINMAAWRGGAAKWHRRMMVDWALCAGMLIAVWMSGPGFLMLHVAAMVVAQCLAAFFAVWLTHHGLEGTGLAARSQRGVMARAAYLMFYHREHHLFPAVPVSRLPQLAARLDDAVPGYARSHHAVLPLLERKR